MVKVKHKYNINDTVKFKFFDGEVRNGRITKLTVDHDSRALFAGDAVVTAGLARRTLTVAARTDTGTGKLYAQQVQISGVQ